MTEPVLHLVPRSPDPSGDGERATPFASSFEHLLAEVERLDLLVRMQVFRARRAMGEDALRGVSVSEEEVDAILGRPAGQPPWASTPPAPALAKVQALADQKAADIARRQAESEARGVVLRLPALAARFGLTRFETDVLLVAIAPEIDLRYERLFVYLNDDVTKRRPTVDTALGLLCRSFDERLAARRCFVPGAPLCRHALLHVGADAAERNGSLLRATLQADERIVEHLHGSDAIDRRIAPHARLVEPRMRLDDLLLPDELKRGLLRFVLEHRSTGEPGPVVYLQGPHGAGKEATAEALCHALGAPLLVADVAALLAAGDDALREAAPKFGREAALWDAAIHWDGIGALLDAGADRAAARAALLAAIEAHPGPMFLAGAEPWEPVGVLAGRAFARVQLPRLDLREQAELWTRALAEPAGAKGPDVDVEALTSMFRLNGGQIREAAAAARDLARFREGGGALTLDDIGRACRLKASRKLASLARSVPAHHRWHDLVLPAEKLAQLQEICLHVKHRSRVFGAWGFDKKLSLGKGLAALFSGPPGTGKTMAAGVIAGELGLELYQIDLSSVVSKYIGETEKHLAQIFADAEANNAVLLFDEADAIFGKRTETRDAHDRYANIETSYLLQRIDAYEGAVLLSTNFARNMDEAFLRRLQFVVDFPQPGFAERLRIWEQIWPRDLPKGHDLDAGFLAHRLEVSGGHIRNMAVAAAFLAADEGASVGMRHVLHAARRELAKMGKMVDKETLAYPPEHERR